MGFLETEAVAKLTAKLTARAVGHIFRMRP
jgi:hypothetical protein